MAAVAGSLFLATQAAGLSPAAKPKGLSGFIDKAAGI